MNLPTEPKIVYPLLAEGSLHVHDEDLVSRIRTAMKNPNPKFDLPCVDYDSLSELEQIFAQFCWIEQMNKTVGLISPNQTLEKEDEIFMEEIKCTTKEMYVRANLLAEECGKLRAVYKENFNGF